MKTKPANSGMSKAQTLTILWLLISAALAYPLYSFLFKLGFNPTLAGVAVFIGICLLYDIPYRARVKAEHEIATSRADYLRNGSC